MTAVRSSTRVYFIKPVGMSGPVKVGCSRLPEARLINLTLWCPFPLEIIGSIPGSYKDERFLHRCFANYHSHGEWFHATKDLQGAIANILQGGIAYARANLSETGRIRSHFRSAETRALQSRAMRRAWEERRRRLAQKATSS